MYSQGKINGACWKNVYDNFIFKLDITDSIIAFLIQFSFQKCLKENMISTDLQLLPSIHSQRFHHFWSAKNSTSSCPRFEISYFRTIIFLSWICIFEWIFETTHTHWNKKGIDIVCRRIKVTSKNRIDKTVYITFGNYSDSVPLKLKLSISGHKESRVGNVNIWVITKGVSNVYWKTSLAL